jgi:acyl carrier protein
MPDDQALVALGELLSRSDSAHAVVASVDWRTLKSAYEAKRPRPFLSQVEDRARSNAPDRSARQTPAADRSVAQQPELQQRFAQAPVHDRREAVAVFVRAQVAKVLALDAARPIDDQQGLFEMGMDSLMSVELKSRLEIGVGHSLPSTLTFNYPSVAALTDFLLADLTATTAPSVAQVVAPELIAAAPIDESDDLSEDELADLLATKLSQLR